MGQYGSELANSQETTTRDTAKESLKNPCDAVESIFKPESSTLLSRYQFRKPSHKKGDTVDQ